MNAAASRLRALVDALVAIALFLMMLITFLDVVGRYVVNRPLPGAAELVQYLMLGFMFLALPLVTLRREHISISLIDSVLGPRGRRLQASLVAAASALVVAVLSVRLWQHGEMLAANRDVIGYLNLPLYPAAFFASVLCAVTALLVLVDIGLGVRGPRGQPPPT